MGRIKATGIFRGLEVEVECFLEDGTPIIEVEGEFSPQIQDEFEELLSLAGPLGGNYWPPADSMLAAHDVLSRLFFTGKPELVVEGDIGEIPREDDDENIVY